MPVISRLRARLAGDHGDRGAVALTVGLLLGSGVLLGMAALVVDVGNLYAERGQLQNGADAGALRVARTCATEPATCSSPAVADVQGVADRYAEENANDGAAAATVCGRAGDLPECPPWEDRLTDCAGPPPQSVSYVEVHTSTRREDGSTVLPPIFAQAVVGGYRGAEVGACSRVAWGPPMRATTVAMTISSCDWQRGTGNGGAYAEAEQVIPVYDDRDPGRCTAPGGSTGGFRWLGDRASGCRASVSVDVGYPIAPGNSGTPNDCEDALARLYESRQPALVPVFDEVDGNEGNAQYTAWGFAAFVVTGWHLPGSDQPSATGTSCGGGRKFCVSGYFTQTIVPGGGAIGGPDLGARVVAPIG